MTSHTDGGELARADQRAMLMERMWEAVSGGTVPPAESDSLTPEADIAFQRCLRCTRAGSCRRWLDGRYPDTGYREFCPNAGLFERMSDR
ncbi:DUF6455 family protein [Aquisalimonas sp.]|uniref:DUF6455 family protein n=1 Tax=unclassified Aquisalimonas TaxID=2644645 RepID=UPI0025BFB4E3|nr:DUF6455 family protein [Aquisalimonas sp.]